MNTEYGIDPKHRIQTGLSGALTVNSEYGVDRKHRIQTGLSGALTVNTEYGHGLGQNTALTQNTVRALTVNTCTNTSLADRAVWGSGRTTLNTEC